MPEWIGFRTGVRFPSGPYLKNPGNPWFPGFFAIWWREKMPFWTVSNRFRVEKLGSKLGSKSKLKSFEKSMVLECFGVLQIKKNDNIRLKYSTYFLNKSIWGRKTFFLLLAWKNIKKRGTEKGRGHAPENGRSACGAYDEGVSVPAFRRPETEGHDCHGTCM